VKLVLGVTDIPYVQKPSPRQRKIRGGTVTTGDVAGFLEDRYHVMEVFARENETKIAGYLEDGLRGSLESLLMGAPPSLDPFGSGTAKIEERFKNFLSLGEMDALGYPGVPTQAAINRASGKRRSARFKRRRGPATNVAPVSFVDTGLFSSSFKAWID
jgi:hypothetical protein